MAVADYDNDGFLDVVVTNGEGGGILNLDAKVQLLHNRGNANHWLKVKLIGTRSNRGAVGASVIITSNGLSQLREASGGIHRFAQDDTIIHFGVGRATVVDRLIVRWPSGKDSVLNGVPADQLVRISEP